MKMKRIFKKYNFIILGIAALLVLVIGSSFAIFNIGVYGTANKITVGRLILNLDETASNGISINPAYPLTDTEGLATQKYIFTLENTGDIPADFTMYLDDITTAQKKMPYQIIRFNLKKQVYDSNGALKATQPSDRMDYLSNTIVSSQMVFDGGTLQAGEKNTYTLNIWMDYNAGNEYQGSSFKGKIRIEGVQQFTKISNAYKYEDTDASKLCITGNESTCVQTDCYTTGKTCSAGDIIDYMVNGTERIRFHVLFDNGTTITMQSQENTVDNSVWASTGSNETGPVSALAFLDDETKSWTSVNDLSYTLGTTTFKTNAFTGCSVSGCTTNTYTMPSRVTKARMITVQEANLLGCNGTKPSCPAWMYNDLDSTTNESYWTMSAASATGIDAMNIDYNNGLNIYNVTNTSAGIRAVVEINK